MKDEEGGRIATTFAGEIFCYSFHKLYTTITLVFLSFIIMCINKLRIHFLHTSAVQACIDYTFLKLAV